jgi:hypothetical protein
MRTFVFCFTLCILLIIEIDCNRLNFLDDSQKFDSFLPFIGRNDKLLNNFYNFDDETPMSLRNDETLEDLLSTLEALESTDDDDADDADRFDDENGDNNLNINKYEDETEIHGSHGNSNDKTTTTNNNNKDSDLPAYCDPPNPCPVGVISNDCESIPFGEYTAEFSKHYQGQQNCMCDDDHNECSKSNSNPSSASPSAHDLNLDDLIENIKKSVRNILIFIFFHFFIKNFFLFLE